METYKIRLFSDIDFSFIKFELIDFNLMLIGSMTGSFSDFKVHLKSNFIDVKIYLQFRDD
jgi:hypothetical protein